MFSSDVDNITQLMISLLFGKFAGHLKKYKVISFIKNVINNSIQPLN